MRMVFHLAVLLLQLLRLSNASPQAPPPPPGRVSFFLQCSHYHPSCQSDSQEAAAAASHIHRHQCLLLHRQALPLPRQPWEQGIIQIFSMLRGNKLSVYFVKCQLFQGITGSQLPRLQPGCTTQTAPQTHLLLVWASGLRCL